MLDWYGVPADPADLSLDRTAEVRAMAHAGAVPARATVIHPGADGSDRRWPVDHFAAVAAALARAGHHVFVTGSESERLVATAVARRAGLPDDAVLAGE